MYNYTGGVAGCETLDAWGRYIYLEDLLAMARLRPAEAVALPDEFKRTATPLRWRNWAEELRSYPDQKFAGLIVDGIRDGFRIGFD